jgi:hypothetical protein
MKSAAMDDLFGHVPQAGELPVAAPVPARASDEPYDGTKDFFIDSIDPDIGLIPRVHTHESIRKRMLAILAKARAAETMPFTERQLRLHKGMFPYMAEWLEEDGEGERLHAEFRAEIARLTANSEIDA